MQPEGVRTVQLFGGRKDGEVIAVPQVWGFEIKMPCLDRLCKWIREKDEDDTVFSDPIYVETYEWDGTFTEEEHRRYRRTE